MSVIFVGAGGLDGEVVLLSLGGGVGGVDEDEGFIDEVGVDGVLIDTEESVVLDVEINTGVV